MENRLVSSSTISDDLSNSQETESLFDTNETAGITSLPVKKPQKHNQPTLAMKLQIISDVEAGKKKRHVTQRCKMRQSQYPELEEILWEWYKEAESQSGKQLPNGLVFKKAKEIADQLGISNFKASQGWVYRFRQRRGVYKNPGAKQSEIKEAPSLNPDLLNQWTFVTIPSILESYKPCDIFTLHETALFFKCTPDQMGSLAGESCTGGKHAKDRISVVFVCNMMGQEKQRLIVVGKFGRPKSLKNVETLPTEYVSNKKAWVIPSYFEKWLIKFDQAMKTAGRKVALLVTPSKNHKNDKTLNAVTLIHLPPNINLQPAHQGIVQELKFNYRQTVLQKHFEKVKHNGPYGKLCVSVLDALLWLRGAWNSVSTQCIRDAFRIAGFYLQGQQEADELPEKPSRSQNEYFSLFKTLKQEMHLDLLVTAEGYLTVDCNTAIVWEDVFLSVDNGKRCLKRL